jgi:putative peptide zinc metalloprotease protein
MSFSAMLPTALRTVPVRRRPDLQFAPTSLETAGGWSVKDPLTLKYHRLEPEQYAILDKLDGQRSLKDVHQAVLREFPTSGLTLVELQQLIMDLHEKGLVISHRTGQGPALQHREQKQRLRRWKQVLFSVLSLKLPGWNAATTLDRMLPWVRWIYHPVTIVLATLFVLSSWLVVLMNFQEFQSRVPALHEFFGWSNIGWLWITLGITKIIHEFGHGLTCHYFGRRCHEMGVIVLVLTPTLYCDTTDSWMLPQRWPRIWIAAAGMLFELVVSAAATFFWWWTVPGTFWNQLALNTVLVTTFSTVVFNANPLMKYDGYYMLSDYLDIPNLREKATRVLDRCLAWCCGFDWHHDPTLPRHHHALFLAYSLACPLYGWVVFSSILLFLYSWLKPHELQSVGIALAVFSLLGLTVTMAMRAWKIAKTPREDRVKWGRPIVMTTVFAVTILGLLLVPIPWYVDAAVLIEPAGVVRVFNPVPGRIEQIDVQPGQTVSAGQILVRLSNEQLTDRRDELLEQWLRQQVTVRTAKAAEDWEDLAVAEAKLNSLRQQLAQAEQHIQWLTLTAPISGTLVAPEPKPEPSLEEQRKALRTWYGTPLDRPNQGAWIEERTEIASLAPNDELQAVLYLPQTYRNEVQLQQAVALQLDVLPGRIFRGTIAELSEEQVESVAMNLSTKMGGPLATKSVPNQQQEQLQELAYAAKVGLVDNERVLRSGMRGSARFIIATHSAGWWLYRTMLRLFRFQL